MTGNAKGPGGFFSSSLVVKYFKMTTMNIKRKIVPKTIIFFNPFLLERLKMAS